jgi:hypothetical protein
MRIGLCTARSSLQIQLAYSSKDAQIVEIADQVLAPVSGTDAGDFMSVCNYHKLLSQGLRCESTAYYSIDVKERVAKTRPG